MTVYDDLFSAEEPPLTLVTTPYDVHASFGLYHEDLDPDDITEKLQVQPTATHRKGDPRLGKEGRVYIPYAKGMWMLHSRDKVDSLDCNKHILWILDELAHCNSVIHKLVRDGYDTNFKCGWFAESENTCPILEKETIRRLAQMDIDFWFDVYL